MYKQRKVSVVLPVYNEEMNIRAAVIDFLSHPAVDEVIAVDNNSKDKSAGEIKKTRARYVHEATQGYGAALRRGMREATGDIIVTVEPDGTFRASDLDKLLAYSDDFDAVFGTRSTQGLVLPGAFMPWSVRMGNIAVGGMLHFLFGGPRITDAGCTFKLIHRAAYEKIKHSLTVDRSHFQPEFMIRVIQHKLRAVEIPVHYNRRVGSATLTGSTWRAAKVGFRMGLFIIAERLKKGVTCACLGGGKK